MKCVSFKRLERGSLLGFADLAMDSGIVLLGCTLHASNGKRWCNPPGRPQLDADRKLMLGDNGKLLYATIVEFVDAKTRYRWSDEAVRAIEQVHPQCKTPAEAGVMSSREAVPKAQNQGSRNG